MIAVEGCAGRDGVWGGSWDCAGQRRVTEQHNENGFIVPMFTLLDSTNGPLFDFETKMFHLRDIYVNLPLGR